MKKFNLFFIAFILILSSCSSDDASLITSGDILGTWKGTSLDYSGNTATNAQGQTINADFVGEAYDMNYTLTFKDDPKIVVSEGSYSLKLTTTVSGETMSQNMENIAFLEAESWSKNDNTLTVFNGDKSFDYTIVELTESLLKLSISTEEDLSQQGINIITTVNAIMTFSRD
ncbi:hypothetical protein [Hwangdonia lutea]|uniref:Lipocalin-like domain-containing protein n=1 Tax=Hwangdonia lutea TaxID=3075823 RepID=A0AA97EKA3_9FLAO|nr:hypothetical protein [Hwangdonia sp. SCSIO 19198]WOD42999.1 hypothetical protein RNZ46_13475 [Hwangdonia sp. SCSIO 19198]